jgi:UDP-3-O-[3-hydroxymyristoyl] glucosamine N-acyltransferase
VSLLRSISSAFQNKPVLTHFLTLKSRIHILILSFIEDNSGFIKQNRRSFVFFHLVVNIVFGLRQKVLNSLRFLYMEFTAKQISELLLGSIEGNPDIKVNRLSKIEEGSPGSLTFLANPKYTPFIYSTKASIVIVNRDFIPEQKVESTLIRVEDAYKAFVHLLEVYNDIQLDKKGIEQPSFIAPSAVVGKDVYIGAFAYIGKNAMIGNNVKIYPQVFIGDNVTIGDNTTLFAGSKVYSDCSIGANCTLHTGSVIGADGFGFTPNSDNEYKKVAQIGNVIVEDYVEIGANTDRKSVV